MTLTYDDVSSLSVDDICDVYVCAHSVCSHDDVSLSVALNTRIMHCAVARVCKAGPRGNNRHVVGAGAANERASRATNHCTKL
jgi:hypothetical protein